MNFDPDQEDENFRTDVRAFLERTLLELFPKKRQDDQSKFDFDKNDVQRWTRALDSKGLLVPHWPNENNAVTWRDYWREILAEELASLQCPETDLIGIDFVGPVLCAFGSEDQKRRYLPAIRYGEQRWCQGFSEPHAGSDVMSLHTTAVRNRDRYIINGEKLWTSNAHFSDMMFALVRIEIPGLRRKPGLSFFLIDMRSPGIQVQPVILIDGTHRVNRVLLENVEVPESNLVGEAGKGWVYARYLLANERTVIAGLGVIRDQLNRLKLMIASTIHGREFFAVDPLIVARVGQFEAELEALEFMKLRVRCARADDGQLQLLTPMLKLRGSELRQRITTLTLQFLGEQGLESPTVLDPALSFSMPTLLNPNPQIADTVSSYLFERSCTIAGGTSEIQRNIIAGTVLQL